MKKVLILCLCLMILTSLSACSRKEEPAQNEKTGGLISDDKELKKENNVKEEAEKEAEDEKKDEQESETEPVAVISHHLVCHGKDGSELVNGTYPEIRLSGESRKKYPKLYQEFLKKNDEFSEHTRTGMETYGRDKLKEDYDLGPYSSEINANPERFDEQLFSLTLSYYDYAGGAHPSHYVRVLNLDPVTGRRLSLLDVLSDTENAPKFIEEKIYSEYPELEEEIKSYRMLNEGEDDDQFAQKLSEDSYTWMINEEGLWICFSPYEIASYAAGYIEITLGYDEYPDLIQPSYVNHEKKDEKKLAKIMELDPEEIPLKDIMMKKEPVSLNNPTWESFCDPVYEYPYAKHISLEKLTEKKSEWLDTDKWAAENGFEKRLMPYADDMYYYEPASPVQYDYMYNELKIYDRDRETLIYDFDLYTLINGPDEKEGRSSAVTQYIRWAQLYKDILYVAVGHNTYASSEPDTSYILAINPEFEMVIWRSEPRVSNALNFKIVGETIICGYGFTAEDDFIYLLDLYTGKTIDRIKVNSGPDQFEIEGETLYVATYNTAYTFKIKMRE